MDLQLTIETDLELPPTQKQEVELAFDLALDFVIGRGRDSDWPLFDPQLALSRKHCRIVCRDDGFVLIDESTNGVFVNGAPAPLGKGRDQRLENGDRLKLGPYSLIVHVTAADEEAEEEVDIETGKTVIEDVPAPSVVAAEAIPDDWGTQENALKTTDDASIPDDWDPSEDAAPAESPQAEAEPEPSVSQKREPLKPQPPKKAALSSAPPSGDAVAAFLEGLGVDPDAPLNAPGEEIALEAREAFEIGLGHVLDLLELRAQTKSRLRVSQTTFRQSADNPLKIARNEREAFEKLLALAATDEAAARDAIESVTDDLRAHPAGMLAGLRAVLNEILDEFDPDGIEAEAASGGGPLTSKASRSLDIFKARYREFFGDAARNEKRLFTPAFADAYGTTSQKLKGDDPAPKKKG